MLQNGVKKEQCWNGLLSTDYELSNDLICELIDKVEITPLESTNNIIEVDPEDIDL